MERSDFSRIFGIKNIKLPKIHVLEMMMKIVYRTPDGVIHGLSGTEEEQEESFNYFLSLLKAHKFRFTSDFASDRNREVIYEAVQEYADVRTNAVRDTSIVSDILSNLNYSREGWVKIPDVGLYELFKKVAIFYGVKRFPDRA